MFNLSNSSIKKKLVAIIMLTSSVALLLACSAFVYFELRTYQDDMRAEQLTLLRIIAESSTAALAFEDVRSAEVVLAALKNEPKAVAAAIYDQRGRIFASHQRDGETADLPASPGEDGFEFAGGHLVGVYAVVLDGKRMGSVYLLTGLSEMYARLTQYAGIVLVVLMTALLAALVLSSVLQKVISAPILQLAQTARNVSKNQNYSLRAKRRSNDEIGLLFNRFNEMMEQIHRRDEMLKRAHDELEDRVEERTLELRREIVERQRAQDQLVAAKEAAEEANRAKSAFLANMSHELRTPLNAIIGYSEMLEDEAGDAGVEEFIPDLRKVHHAGRHLLTLINDVLDISKIEAGRMDLHLEPCSIADMVTSVVATVDPLARSQGNELVIKCADHGEMVADPTRFQQSLLNLLSNACKFTKNGSVTLEVERDRQEGREWVHWHVRDTGIGIAAEHHQRLFQSFSQVDSSSTREHGGTGLGLAISQRFCRMMGGTITLESMPGKGSTFSIHMPVDGAAADDSNRGKRSEAPGRNSSGPPAGPGSVEVSHA